MRTCWHFSWEAYNLKTSDTAVLLRRICMWVVLILRTFLSILAIIVDAYGGRIVSMIVGIILAVIGFLFIAWCLATIGEAKGRRRVCGVMVVSKHVPGLLSFHRLMAELGPMAFRHIFVTQCSHSSWSPDWVFRWNAGSGCELNLSYHVGSHLRRCLDRNLGTRARELCLIFMQKPHALKKTFCKRYEKRYDSGLEIHMSNVTGSRGSDSFVMGISDLTAHQCNY